MKKIKGNVSISKVNAGGEYFMEVRVQCETSRTTFVEARMSMVDFAHCMTGLANQPANLEVRGLNSVGKQKEQKSIIVELPDDLGYGDDRIAKATELCEAHKDEGWTVNKYFRSQRSFYTKDGKNFAQTTQYRYVEIDNE